VNEKSNVRTAATLAAAAALVALACTCSTCGLSDFSLPSLGGGGGSDADAFYDALLEHEYEDPFDPELLVMADDDGDGLPEATYPLTVEEEVAPGVYLDRWLYLDPNGEEIDGTLQLVLENTTDEAVDVTFVDEIPKTVREHIEPGDIQVEPPVEITILDEDPRYEVRVFQFAAGLRQTIAVTPVKAEAILDFLDDPEAAINLTISEKVGGVIEMTARATARDYEFLRRAKRCVEYTQPGVELTEKQQKEAWACNMRLVAEFRENFTADVCSEAGLYRIRPNQGSDSGIPAGWQQSCEQFFAQSCTEHENDGVRAMCLEAMRRESYIECTLWPAAEQEHCRLVADRSHTENCSMMIADRASRRVCCDKMTGDLKDLCLEDNTGDEVAEAADGQGSESAEGGEGEDEASAGTTGLDFFTQENAERVCPTLHDSFQEASGSPEQSALSCRFGDETSGELRLVIDAHTPEYAEGEWNRLTEQCQEGYVVTVSGIASNSPDVTDCGQDQIFWSMPESDVKTLFSVDSQCESGMGRYSSLYRRLPQNIFLEAHGTCLEESNTGPDNLLPMMDAAETLVGETLTLGEVLGTE
jgi:hypothetical protein